MKRLAAVLFILCVFGSAASADTLFYNRSFEVEKAIDAWAAKAQYGYGYEADFDISHFFPLNTDQAPKPLPQADIVKIFDTLPVPTLKDMYLELYGNDAAIRYLIKYYNCANL